MTTRYILKSICHIIYETKNEEGLIWKGNKLGMAFATEFLIYHHNNKDERCHESAKGNI